MRYIKPDKEAIAIAIKIPGGTQGSMHRPCAPSTAFRSLSLLERVLVAEAIAFTDKLIEKD
jgi:hypothetical protein